MKHSIFHVTSIVRKLSTLLLLLTAVGGHRCFAQAGYLTTIAGNGTWGYSGDGGAATLAQMGIASGICIDTSGNIYISDPDNHVIRKITPDGIIHYFAGGGTSSADGVSMTSALIDSPSILKLDAHGNIYYINRCQVRKIDMGTGLVYTVAGSGVYGFSGDGGPATAAALYYPKDLYFDRLGNLIISDAQNSRIRKVNAAGIITTIAGISPGGGAGPSGGYSGDGGPATAALINYPCGLTMDNIGNLYFGDAENNRVRKIDTSGIITTYAGTGINGVSGDGGPATAAKLDWPNNVYMDPAGYLFVSGSTIRKIRPDGVISTIAGGGTSPGSDIPALTANISRTAEMQIDNSGTLYFTDPGHFRACKITGESGLAHGDSFYLYVDNMCSNPNFSVVANSALATYTQVTNYGDGSFYSSSLTPSTSLASSDFVHVYNLPGTYTIKTILYNAGIAIDSVKLSYTFKMCNMLQAKFYVDRNNDGIYQADSDVLSYYPTTIEIDSNSVAVDTIVATSGLYYVASGSPGDIYQLKIISTIAGLLPSAPASGIITDTFQSATTTPKTSYFGLTCSGAPSNNLGIHTANICGIHRYGGLLLVDNLHCSLTGTASVTLSISPKYQPLYLSHTPSYVSGNTLGWNLNSVSASGVPILIHVIGEEPAYASYYLPGDTVHSAAIIGPFTGDSDTTDNIANPVDTVKSGYDPNFIDVSPRAYIPAGTQLQYTVGFENTGNDTAFNIYILDTLSDDLDPSTLKVVIASAAMDIYKFAAGGHTIVKFDFPHINLLDSSHHNLCDGMLIYTIKARNGLPDCTHIPARAGIYFDENPVVMTNTIENITGPAPAMPVLTGLSSMCSGDVTTINTTIPGGTWSASNTNASVSGGTVTALADGPVFVYYTVPAACGPVTSQFLINIGAPYPGFVISPTSICAGSSISLVSTVAGGVWNNFGAHSSLSGAVLTGISAGPDTVYYFVTNACGTSSMQQTISVDTFIQPQAVMGLNNVCVGSTIFLADLTPGGTWSVRTGNASIVGGAVTGVTAGVDTAVYTVSNACGDGVSVMPLIIHPASYCGAGVSNVSKAPVNIYPNPTNDQLYIETAGDYTSLYITNNVGQVVIQQKLGGNKTQVNVQQLPAGVYYIMLKGNNDNVVRRFIKQ